MFVLAHNLKTQPIFPLFLFLIDGTINNFVSWVINLPIKFNCGSLCLWEFFVMILDNFCKVVLDLDCHDLTK